MIDDWPAGNTLHDVCSYSLNAPGKLFRPILLIESAGAVGSDVHAVLPAAAGTEGAHVASLVHDDIIDGDDVRRGRPSTPNVFGRDRAIVGGDALIFYLFGSLARCAGTVPSDRIVSALAVAADAGVQLCRGQMMEEEIAQSYDTRVDSYLAMIDGKTAALFRGSCSIGALLGGGTTEEVELLGQYGTLLGLAFQIHDDLLPFISSSQTTGKSQFSDVANRRLTLPVLFGRIVDNGALATTIDDLLRADGPVEQRFHRLRGLLAESGALDRAAETARGYADQALAAVAALEPTPSRESLEFFARSAITREN
ncbi:polyprenyl synthetase family protein [Nocardia transvalensis]|uniref:polyprenyl synthetase family protein n=1 Tax=Nocardia transvalensis TaxID=37333 RepID=UPI0018936185|nr:polyprenyl synthetase family protein [Nocardia transvalensis]MBF6329432.1 polyprenyl synthetase family protein [Nocardia transvalensis]